MTDQREWTIGSSEQSRKRHAAKRDDDAGNVIETQEHPGELRDR